MKYQVQIGNADVVERDDETLPSANWGTVASGDTHEEALEYLLRAANDQDFDIINSWIRLVEDDKIVLTF